MTRLLRQAGSHLQTKPCPRLECSKTFKDQDQEISIIHGLHVNIEVWDLVTIHQL